MRRSVTPSFILEMKLLTSERDEASLSYRFSCGCHIHNILVRYIRKQLFKLYTDHRYQECLEILHEIPAKNKAARAAVQKELADIRISYGLSKYQLYGYVKEQQHRYRKHIDSRTAQMIAGSVWNAVEKVLYGNGRQVHFTKYNDFHSLESNDNKTGIRYRGHRILWNGLSIGIAPLKTDYEKEAMTHRVKYCRIIRKQIGARWHYYVQLTMEGIPPQKHARVIGRIGIDPGTRTMAVVSEHECVLKDLTDGLPDYSAGIRRIERAVDRSRRAMNPGNYNEDGTVKRGKKKWSNSKNYKRLSAKKCSLQRKQAAARKCSHEAFANDIVAMGDEVYTEDMNYKALQARGKETTRNKKGRFNRKGRYGKSLFNAAPSMLLSIIDRKLKYGGGELRKVNTRTFRASQYNHITDEYIKKRLSRRHAILNGHWVQRDLYSAFLLMNSDASLEHADRERCSKTYDRFLKNHDRHINELIQSNRSLPSSFGIRRTA